MASPKYEQNDTRRRGLKPRCQPARLPASHERKTASPRYEQNDIRRRGLKPRTVNLHAYPQAKPEEHKNGGRGWESNPPIHLHGQAGFEDR